jgi:hypothetical protein
MRSRPGAATIVRVAVAAPSVMSGSVTVLTSMGSGRLRPLRPPLLDDDPLPQAASAAAITVVPTIAERRRPVRVLEW